jgi:hypothetical protein
LLLSVTVAVKFDVLAAVGVPLMVPPALRLSPAGNAPPLTLQTFPPVPPLAASACEYAVPTVPFGSEEVVMLRAAAFAGTALQQSIATLTAMSIRQRLIAPAP